MSEILMDDKIHDGMTINDPACGTGRTLLMALKHLRESKHVEPKLYANDLSMTCAKMTLLNFCINSVDGAVTCGDALRMDTENFTFFKLDKVRNLTTGAVLTTYWQYTLADVEKVSEKRQKWFWWIAEHGWVKYTHTVWADAQPIIDDFERVLEGNPPTEGIVESIQKELEENNKIDPLPTEIKTDESGQLKLF